MLSRITSPFARMMVAGLGLGVLIYFIPPLYGEGYNVVNNLLHENYLQALGTNFFLTITWKISGWLWPYSLDWSFLR